MAAQLNPARPPADCPEWPTSQPLNGAQPEKNVLTPFFVETPAAWRGAELLQRADWLHTLHEREIEEMADSVQGGDGKAIELADRSSYRWPTFTGKLAQMQASLEYGSGAVMIRGFPVETFSQAETMRIFWGLVQHLGTPVSQSAAGEKIFHVRDEGFRLDDPRARGPNTRKRLSFHTDRCDVIAFMCLRQAKSGGENDLVSSAALYNRIKRQRPDLLAELMKPYYYLRHSVDRGNDLAHCRQPIFSFCDGHFAGSFLRVLIERAHAAPDLPDLSETQREALDYLEEVAEDPSMHVSIRQQPGDILLLNNWVTFHRRSEFEDYVEPHRKRHILRVWLSMPNSRPISPWFKDNYGATAGGAIRGGMRAAAPQ